MKHAVVTLGLKVTREGLRDDDLKEIVRLAVRFYAGRGGIAEGVEVVASEILKSYERGDGMQTEHQNRLGDRPDVNK
jgi:hypothetical protein